MADRFLFSLTTIWLVHNPDYFTK